MPFKSEAQRRAMYAAAEGHSTLGIPKSVGEKFVEHGKKDSTDSPKTELDIARAIRDGELSSPQVYENVALFDLRITGTGLSKRDNPDEWVLRPEENFLTDEFVERCNGLPVVFEHPEDSILSTDEYRERAIGTIILPYLKGTEVRGIAKIFDQGNKAIIAGWLANVLDEQKDMIQTPLDLDLEAIASYEPPVPVTEPEEGSEQREPEHYLRTRMDSLLHAIR